MRHAPVGVKLLAGAAALMSLSGGIAWAALDGVSARFSSGCGPSHANNDDPIVFPGKPGWSHRHQYFGARGTNAYSKPRKLRGGPTTCERSADTAAYWVPTLSIDRREVEPVGATIYYVAAKKPRESVMPFPAGLRMIAGRASSQKRQPKSKVTWSCLVPPDGWRAPIVGPMIIGVAHRRVATPHPHCGQRDARLSLRIHFPDCWDGRRLDSVNHRRHVRYSQTQDGARNAKCPASHPVPMPQIRLTVVYPTNGHPDADRIALSSGGIHSGHADFLNSWDQAALERLVRDCINHPRC